MNKSVPYIIVDDNRLDQLTLLSKAKTFDRLLNIAVCNNADEALEAIKTLKPDIAFLDVDMPGQSGIELLRIIKDDVPVAIFVTSHMEYALESYELAAFDFLMKPVKAERFIATVERAFDYMEMKEKAIAYSVQVEKEIITIKDGHEHILIPLRDIIYLEAMGDYTRIITLQKKYMTLTSLSVFITQLPENLFSRIHRSYAVNLKKITAFQNNELFIGSFSLPVSKSYKTSLMKLIG